MATMRKKQMQRARRVMKVKVKVKRVKRVKQMRARKATPTPTPTRKATRKAMRMRKATKATEREQARKAMQAMKGGRVRATMQKQAMSSSAARAKCNALGSKCAGYSCRTKDKKCYVRAAGSVLNTNAGFTTYEKGACGSTKPKPAAASPYCSHSGKLLSKHITGTQAMSSSAARAKCNALGSKCAGYSCNTKTRGCYVRAA